MIRKVKPLHTLIKKSFSSLPWASAIDLQDLTPSNLPLTLKIKDEI